jgi:hypothetical protein
MSPHEHEIYDRLKHIVELYRKKGLSSIEIRQHFLKPKNFNGKLIHNMRDLKHIYDEQHYPLDFETTVYNCLFYRVLMDRIYYEKDNPQAQDESVVKNFRDYLNESNKKLIKEAKKMNMDDLEKMRMDNISTRQLTSIIANYEFKASKADAKTAKNYKEMAKVYKEELEKRQGELHKKMMSKIDSEGRWIKSP